MKFNVLPSFFPYPCNELDLIGQLKQQLSEMRQLKRGG